MSAPAHTPKYVALKDEEEAGICTMLVKGVPLPDVARLTNRAYVTIRRIAQKHDLPTNSRPEGCQPFEIKVTRKVTQCRNPRCKGLYCGSNPKDWGHQMNEKLKCKLCGLGLPEFQEAPRDCSGGTES